MQRELRLILGDQLNINHSWYQSIDNSVTYVMMEVRPESEYVTHHIQKILGIFAAMRSFAEVLQDKGHQVRYLKIGDKDNKHSFLENIRSVVAELGIMSWSYQLPDEYRLDQLLLECQDQLQIPCTSVDTEHFLTNRSELSEFFKGKKSYLMESYYRNLRKKYDILMEDGKPITGKWNYDHDNRKKLPKGHTPWPPKVYTHDLTEIYDEIVASELPSIGKVDASNFLWTITRKEALELFDFFLENMFPYFGSYQDAMSQEHWSVYHSRISFAMNIKLISPLEIIQKAESYWLQNSDKISIAQAEGFIRQILGWREYMRGIYWAHMPEYSTLNYFQNNRALPSWFWTGKTKMNCLSQSIKQSLEYAYAHHIQRLMVTGNFALLAGINPDEADRWYLGIYIDAFEWVEITNTRGMSQFADGGIVGTKPYVSSGSYVHKMGDYCTHCSYDHKKKTGDGACPFNSLYWNFIDEHREKLASNRRMSMMYRVWDKYSPEDKESILLQADSYLSDIENL